MSLLNSIELKGCSKVNTGSIDIIMGCMFSGKSTELIRLKNRYKVLEKNVIIINHSLDDRYAKNAIATHSNQQEDCISLSKLSDLDEGLYSKSDVIIIEEAQFFENLYEFALNACEKDNKNVIVVGLDGDSYRKEFGDILKLIPVCDSVRKLYGLCVLCKDGTKACFTKRLSKNDAQILISSTDFIAVCRKHYHM